MHMELQPTHQVTGNLKLIGLQVDSKHQVTEHKNNVLQIKLFIITQTNSKQETIGTMTMQLVSPDWMFMLDWRVFIKLLILTVRKRKKSFKGMENKLLKIKLNFWSSLIKLSNKMGNFSIQLIHQTLLFQVGFLNSSVTQSLWMESFGQLWI